MFSGQNKTPNNLDISGHQHRNLGVVLWTLRTLQSLHADEAGFLISSELVLVSTIVVIGLIVGMAEVANGVNEELEDVGSAIGHINQTYLVKGSSGHKGWMKGSQFRDHADECDGQFDISCNSPPTPEGRGHHGYGY